MEIFHTDRGSEFKNQIIAESIYNIVKTEFVFGEVFSGLGELELAWFDYNNVRIRGRLGYMTPNAYRAVAL